ncbi:hypothetical protein BD626DRAFT_548631 [Schizophyllum amplum]|uniref:Protein UNC80 C-terminal domain-containing protein n=1 Tax=Schizophyllum amplum TaxID=97359 RepID=A0A550CBR7_9AGAR|nr:hypothetical protein BD626DRAFT_548631 [Auriculariopsis ampla]
MCVLLRECRLYTRSLKPASWLSRCVSWFAKYEADDSVRHRTDDEVNDFVEQIRAMYIASEQGTRSAHQRRSTIVLLAHAESSDGAPGGAEGLLKEKKQLLKSIEKGFAARVLKLLVTMAALLTREHVERIGTYLWTNYLDEREAATIGPACFLVMQCAEKAPRDLIATIEVDLQSSDETTRVQAIQRLGLLINWRFQILSQQVVMDRAHRPFKLARGPLPFVAADIGSSKYVVETNAGDAKDALPAELKKRLAEIGWAQDESPVDQRSEWARTPLSVLPMHQSDRFDMTVDRDATPMASPNNSPAASPQRPGQERGRNPSDASPMLLRRNSSSGGPLHGAKRRPVFVPSLTNVFPDLVMLVFDPSFAVASAARAVILDLMRNDPALLLRPLLDYFVAESRDMPRGTTVLRALLHVHQHTPPSLAFQLFNSIIGYLKHNTRQMVQEPLGDFAAVLGIAGKLVTQVSQLSIREMRRAKIEALMIPSGSLWFPPSAPGGPMFPRAPSHYNPFTYDPDLMHVTTIRIAQNGLLLAMLKRNPQDVQLVRRTMTRLVLPVDSTPSLEPQPLEMKDFVPRQKGKAPQFKSADEITLAALSSMLSRSYVLLVAQIFRCLPRHLNDREELSVLIDGLNRILLVHGDDIGIVAHTLIALMVASTRFRRLFTSGGGYTMFMPALLKVYTENEANSGIRGAIDYAGDRFWALHREVFIFQTLDVMSHVLMVPKVDATWICDNIFKFFWTLHQVIPPARSTDAAGIHDQNKEQEREALLVSTAEEKPQAFLASLRNENQVTKVDIPEEFEAKKPHIENFIRLFLTVIAHDPSIRRAEQFLRAFRFMTHSLCTRSHPAVGAVMRDGIDALSMVLLKLTSKNKSNEAQPIPAHSRAGDDTDSIASADALLDAAPATDNAKGASDVLSMRLDYLHLVVAYAQAGGDLPTQTMQHVVDVFRLTVQDSMGDVRDSVSAIFCDYSRAMLWRDTPRTPKEIIAFLKVNTPIISSFATTLDFSGVFDILSRLASNTLYANDRHFCQLITNQVCAAGLAACESAASQNLLVTLPFRSSLINLVSKAVHLRHADVLEEVERCTPSHDFLAHIVLPLVISLPTYQGTLEEAHLASAGTNAVPGAWMRLLSYAMSSKQVTSGRSKVEQKRRSQSSSTPHVPTFVFILQVIKVIVVRAESILSTSLPGVWSRVAAFLMSTLDDGNAAFATAYLRSPTHSPSHSPRASLDVSNPMIHFPDRPQSFKNPRAVDYALWSFLELLCVYRSPLLLQMRLFMQEKILALNHDLRAQHGPSRSRRVSSTAFSKPRRRLSSVPSPESSPKLGAFPRQSARTTYLEDRQAGFHGLSDGGGNPRIVHLGLVSRPPSPFNRPTSPSVEASRVTRIGSLTLIKATYERIRIVQSVLGYDEVLPMPGDEERDVQVTTWTRAQALEAVLKETRQLTEEFDETFGDETVLVDADISMTS